MSWNADRAKSRIREHLKTVPEVDRHVALDSAVLAKRGLLSRMPLREAFVVEGAHLYGQLLDFEDLVTEHGQETETAHRRLLRFLNMHYRVWDSLVDGDDGDRIDYHGVRLHAVIASPVGDPAAQIGEARRVRIRTGHLPHRNGPEVHRRRGGPQARRHHDSR